MWILAEHVKRMCKMKCVWALWWARGDFQLKCVLSCFWDIGIQTHKEIQVKRFLSVQCEKWGVQSMKKSEKLTISVWQVTVTFQNVHLFLVAVSRSTQSQVHSVVCELFRCRSIESQSHNNKNIWWERLKSVQHTCVRTRETTRKHLCGLLMIHLQMTAHSEAFMCLISQTRTFLWYLF